jgi:3-oxoacyl-[acyl-carrier-protein] synthase II
MGAVSPFGRDVTALVRGLVEGRSAIKILDELADYGGLRTRLAALVPGVDGKELPRNKRRSMSRQSIFAVLAAREALAQAALPETEYGSGRYGVVVGTTISSLETSENFFIDHFRDKSFARMKTSLFFKTMNHSAAANVAHFLVLKDVCWPRLRPVPPVVKPWGMLMK